MLPTTPKVMNSMYPFSEFERYWREEWTASGVFEAEPSHEKPNWVVLELQRHRGSQAACTGGFNRPSSAFRGGALIPFAPCSPLSVHSGGALEAHRFAAARLDLVMALSRHIP